MEVKRERQECKQFSVGLSLSKVQTEQMKGRDETMLQRKIEYWQEVNSK